MVVALPRRTDRRVERGAGSVEGTRVTATMCGVVRAFITALDSGVPLRDVEEAASHSDPRTTMRHDRAWMSLDRHGTYIVAAFLVGAAQ
jgi:hypothetical protein